VALVHKNQHILITNSTIGVLVRDPSSRILGSSYSTALRLKVLIKTDSGYPKDASTGAD